MLWEDAFSWKSSITRSSSEGFLVRGSGWAMITPLEGRDHELSVVHSGSFIQMNAKDGSTIKLTDVFVSDIVEYMQTLQKARIATMETILLSSMAKEMEQ